MEGEGRSKEDRETGEPRGHERVGGKREIQGGQGDRGAEGT